MADEELPPVVATLIGDISQYEESLAQAEAATEQFASSVTESGAAAVDSLNSTLEELAAEFESSDALFAAAGANLGDALVTAMADILGGLEPEINALTSTELEILDQFYAELEAQGEEAAIALAAQFRTASASVVASVDLIAEGLSTVGVQMGETSAEISALAAEIAAPLVVTQEEIDALGADIVAVSQRATAALGEVVVGLDTMAARSGEAALASDTLGAGAAEAGGAMSGLGSVLMGPVGYGLFAAAYGLSLLIPALGSSSNAAQEAAKDQQALAQAVSQDSNMIGANTVATITNQLATSGAADTLKSYGISLADATAAVAGVNSAQNLVNGTLDNQITSLQNLITEQAAHSSSVNTDIENEKRQLEQLQATRDAMQQLQRDVVNAVEQQNELTQATLNAEKAADVFNVQVRAGVLSLQQQAQSANVSAAAMSIYLATLVPGTEAYTNAVDNQIVALQQSAVTAGINATALNDSLAPQSQLSDEAVGAAVAYQQASGATSAYTNSLNALYGQYGNTSQAQASFTLALAGLKGNITDGTDAVNLNTDAGAKNFSQFQSVATAAETYSEKLYQQTGDTAQATAALQTMATQLDKAAIQAGLTKTQVQELNTELFGVPDVKNITIKLDKSDAENQMLALDSFISSEIADINNTPITPQVSGRNIPARASGGPVSAGTPYWVGEEGKPEVFVPGADGYITPQDMLQPIGLGAPVGQFSATNAGSPSVISNLTVVVQAGAVLYDKIQFADAVVQALAQRGMRVPNQNTSFQSTRGLKNA